MSGNIWIYILVSGLVSFVIRNLPLTFIRKPITNRFIRSFLYYIPYAVLTAMTIPAIFTATASVVSACAGLAVAVILALQKRSLTTVALASCLAVYLTELIMTWCGLL